MALTASWAWAQPPFYRITHVGSLAGNYTRGHAMNNAGQVTGEAQTNILTAGDEGFRVHAFLWDGTVLQDLGAHGRDFGSGHAINASGQVAGTVHSFTTSTEEAFLWDGSSMRVLGSTSGASAINNSGQVTGSTNAVPSTTGVGYHAFLWNGTTSKDLGTFGGGNSRGIDINGAGQVTGYAQKLGDTAWHAFRWNGATLQDLGTLGGTHSYGYAINAAGQVTGLSTRPNPNVSRAFLSDGSKMRNLGSLGGSYSAGYAINILGQVAGDSFTTGNTSTHAFLWNGVSMEDLGTLGGTDSFAAKVSTAGQVTGRSALPERNVARAFLWDGLAMHNLMDLIDPRDPLRSRVGFTTGVDINNRGQILVRGWLDNPAMGYEQTFVLTPVLRHDLKSFELNKSEVAGCLNVTGTVTLTRAAPAGGVIVTIKDNIAAAVAPLTVKVAEGLTSKRFIVRTAPVETTQSGVVSVIMGGSAKTKGLIVRPMGVKSVSLTPNPVVGSQDVVGNATLECKAGPGPISVTLASSKTSVAQPSQSKVVVEPGVQSISFKVTTSPVTANKAVTISAMANKITKFKALSVTP